MSTNIQFLCTSFTIANKCEPLMNSSFPFGAEYQQLPLCKSRSNISCRNEIKETVKFSTHSVVYCSSLPMLGTDTYALAGYNFIYGPDTSPFSDVMRSCKFFPHVSKMPTFIYIYMLAEISEIGH